MMYTSNPYSDFLASVNSQWPYKQAKDYKIFNSIVQIFPHLKNININRDLKSNKNNIGLIIRSANDDNVHKAIKFGIWTTTPKNKIKLQQLWQKNQKQNTQVYLFFSVVKSGMFEGVARLTSDYYEETFPFWWENHSMKFKGFFCIEWIYIKDINYKHFDGLYNIQGEEVTKSKDCDVLDSQTTNQMLQIYDKKNYKRYIFDDFQKMDDRQKNYTRKMYQYVLQQQQAYSNYNYKQNIPQQIPQNATFNLSALGSFSQPQQGNIQFTQMISIPPQIMRQNPLDPKNAPNLGFQMNPVSKNRKK